MPTNYEPLVLTIEPAYVGSAVSPTVDITETSEDVTVTITDINGEHSYTVEKTDQAIADAQAAASAANNAASAASTAATRANTSADNADAATTAANSAAAAATAATVDTEAATAAANSAASSATSSAASADTAAANANAAADRVDAAIDDAESAATAANSAATSATNAASAANTAASNANAKATLADTAASNANTKAGLANTAANSANSAAQSASSAASTASTAASNADAKATAANTAASAANTAASSANDAAARVDAALETLDDDLKISDSASGSSVLTNGCALLDVEGDGWAEQDGTPTPENPQEIRVAKGRNLFDGTLLNGRINSSGTIYNVGYESSKHSDYIEVEAGEKYTYSASETINEALIVACYDSSKTFMRSLGNMSNSSRLTVTVPSGAKYVCLSVYNTESQKIQFERGSQATPYVPYGHVGLEIKQGSTLVDCIPVPIPEEGLASVRDGTKDLLAIDSAGHVLAGKRVQRLYFDGTDSSGWLAEGSYASTGGGYYRYDNMAYGSTAVVTASGFRSNYFNNIAILASAQDNAGKIGIGNTYALPRIRTVESTAPQTVETLMAQFQANPFELFLPLATPTTIDLGYIDLPLMPDGCTVSIPELHNIGVEWVVTRAEAIPDMVADVRKWALHEIALAGDAELSTIAAVENATASANYAVGSYLVHGGTLYRVTTAIATGETITPGSNVTATTVMAEIIRLTA